MVTRYKLGRKVDLYHTSNEGLMQAEGIETRMQPVTEAVSVSVGHSRARQRRKTSLPHLGMGLQQCSSNDAPV
jgi:hypothetical protein